MKTPQEFIRNIWKSDLPIINSGEYIGNTHKDNAYTYGIKGLNDKYSNAYHFKNGKLFNMYWDSFKCNSKTNNKDILKNSVIISKEAYRRLYGNPKEFKSFENYKSLYGEKAKFSNYIHNYLHLYLEHLTPMKQSFDDLVNLRNDELDDAHILECFSYAGLALITKEESEILDSHSHVTTEDVDCLKRIQIKLGKTKIKDKSIELARQLNAKTKEASLKEYGDGLIRLVYLSNRKASYMDENDYIYKTEQVEFVNSRGQTITIEEAIEELVNNKFLIDQYK